jgi:hypothetical protein
MAAAKTVGQARQRALSDPLVAAIVGADDIRHEDIDVPEWGGVKLRVRGLDGATRDWYEGRMYAIRAAQRNGHQIADVEIKMANYRSEFVRRCLFNPDTDEPVPITAEQLGAKSSRVVGRLFDLANRLSGMDDDAVEEAEGNSPAAPSGSST